MKLNIRYYKVLLVKKLKKGAAEKRIKECIKGSKRKDVSFSKLDEKEMKRVFNGLPAVRISALTGEGIDDLRRAIRDLVLDGGSETDSTGLAPNLRHKEALKEAERFFEHAMRSIGKGLPLDIIAMDLQSGLEALGEIIGETTQEAVLDQIFSQFCIGK